MYNKQSTIERVRNFINIQNRDRDISNVQIKSFKLLHFNHPIIMSACAKCKPFLVRYAPLPGRSAINPKEEEGACLLRPFDA